MQKIDGRVLFNIETKNGRLALQYGKWAQEKTKWFQQLYLKIPGSTNKHWPWQ